MIDHMILDLQKYYKGQVPNYIGRKIKLPLKPIPFYGDPSPYNGTGDVKSTILEITEDGATATTTSGSFNYAGTICQVVIQTCGIVLNEGKDTKKINGTFQTFVCPRFLNDEQQNIPNSSSMPGWLCLSQIIENGGVSHSLLNHVCHALILAGKEISMALEKMKYQLKDWYEGQVPNYIGMTIKAPQQNLDSYIIETFPNDTETIKLDHNNASDGNTASPDVLDGQIVQGQIALDADDCWLMIFVPATTGIYAGKYLNRWIKYTDLVQNGGGIG